MCDQASAKGSSRGVLHQRDENVDVPLSEACCTASLTNSGFTAHLRSRHMVDLEKWKNSNSCNVVVGRMKQENSQRTWCNNSSAAPPTAVRAVRAAWRGWARREQ